MPVFAADATPIPYSEWVEAGHAPSIDSTFLNPAGRFLAAASALVKAAAALSTSDMPLASTLQSNGTLAYLSSLGNCVTATPADTPTPSAIDRLKAEAVSDAHLLTHHPKNPYCESCSRANCDNIPHRIHESADPPVAFGDLLTADHMILRSSDSQGVHGEKTALVILDVATDYIGVDGALTRDALNTELALRDFQGKTPVTQFYSDDSGEIAVAARQLGWSHPRSAPYKHQSNGRAEQCVKRVKRGARVLLLQAGLTAKWWPYATRHWAHSHNCELRSYGDSLDNPYHRRFGYEFEGLRIPFGAKVWYKLSSAILTSATHSDFDPTTLPGIFLGWELLPGHLFRKTYLVVPLEAFKSGAPTRVFVKRVQEVIIPQGGWSFPLKSALDATTHDLTGRSSADVYTDICDEVSLDTTNMQPVNRESHDTSLTVDTPDTTASNPQVQASPPPPQPPSSSTTSTTLFDGLTIEFLADGSTRLNGTYIRKRLTSTRPVSYTHLTLPTN